MAAVPAETEGGDAEGEGEDARWDVQRLRGAEENGGTR